MPRLQFKDRGGHFGATGLVEFYPALDSGPFLSSSGVLTWDQVGGMESQDVIIASLEKKVKVLESQMAVILSANADLKRRIASVAELAREAAVNEIRRQAIRFLLIGCLLVSIGGVLVGFLLLSGSALGFALVFGGLSLLYELLTCYLRKSTNLLLRLPKCFQKFFGL